MYHKNMPLRDAHNRTIRDLRISLTDRCNFRCFYCLPNGEPPLARKETILTFEEIAYISNVFVSLGIEKIRLTGGEPLIRKGVDLAMRMLGNQFVTGQTIGEALKNSVDNEKRGYRYSYDMLGEAALTAHDAAFYFKSYETAIHAIGKASNGRGIKDGPGISVKLSALHPRYSRAQRSRTMNELLQLLKKLLLIAKQYNIGLNIDAEEDIFPLTAQELRDNAT